MNKRSGLISAGDFLFLKAVLMYRRNPIPFQFNGFFLMHHHRSTDN